MTLTGKTIGELNLLQFPTNETLIPVEYDGSTYHITFSSITYNEGTYSQFVTEAGNGELTPGRWYLMTDFQTCYDQPDYNFDGDPITTGNYKTGTTEPILLLAVSTTGFSPTVYSTLYPQDKISYDITWNTTEVTNSPAKGRITERIDNFNNRTDYDHRSVLFRRYDNYYYEETDKQVGTIELIENTGEVIGTGTSFTSLNEGDYIAIPNLYGIFFEVLSIASDTNMVVTGLTISSVSPGTNFYQAQKRGLTYKQNNISIEYTEHPTFLFDDETIISNYIGDVASFIDWRGSGFLLPNNVFGEDVIGNRIGNQFINNTFDGDVEHNVIGDEFRDNTIYNDSDFADNQIGVNFRNNLIICDGFNYNVIGDSFNDNKIFNEVDFADNQIGVYFNNNIIYDDFEENKIGNNFDSNIINSEFTDNIIGNDFNNNDIYSRYYQNEILFGFNNNTIGDFGNLNEFEFYRNYIRNNFNNNIIRQDFQNNQIGTNFQQNEINGEFIGNTILNGFNNNATGDYFAVNNIGNGFNNNTIYENFFNNTTDYYFYSNIISNEFQYNNIGTFFQNNEPLNSDLFGWNNLSTVSSRTYDRFNNVVGGGQLGRRILGKELVMKVISTSQYFKIKFTQWTQNANGGGFQYERQEIDSNGSNIGPSVIFTKTNYGSEVDVIVEGVVELTRGVQNGIYNVVTEGGWNGSVSPQDTEWNSIYTQEDNGENFSYNTIGIYFNNNTLGSYFQYNQIGNRFDSNTIASDFGYGGNQSQGNRIGNDFRLNTIGEYFYNNSIPDNFSSNQIGNYFQWNVVDTVINGVDFTTFYGNISGITYSSIGTALTDGSYTNLGGETNGLGVNSLFNIDVVSGSVTSVSVSDGGKLYNVNDTITIPGTSLGGVTGQITTFTVGGIGSITGTTGTYTNILSQGGSGSNATFDVTVVDGLVDVVSLLFPFGTGYLVNDVLTLPGNTFGSTEDINITVDSIYSDDVVITVSSVSQTPSVYELYTCQIFERQGGDKRLSFYDSSDILTIKNINE